MKPKSLVRWIGGLAGIGVLLFVRQHSSPAPTLGARDGRLAECPDTPNCVCSRDTDESHAIRPLTMKNSEAETMTALRALFASMPRARVVSESTNYLRVEFSTPILRFVDDVETLIDPTGGLVHIRSASRVGRSDLGVNRKRVEQIRRLWEKLP